MTVVVSGFLRRVLVLDAAISGVTALLFLFAAHLIAPLLSLPEGLLRYSGVALVPFVIYVGLLAGRGTVSRGAVSAIIAMNVAWVVASLWLLVGRTVQPNTLGYVFVIVQALAVALFAEMQYVGLRRADARAAA